MAYFLKKSRNKKGLYLQIYENHWDRGRGHTAQTSVKALGYEHELRESGIDDPIAHFKAEVDGMNAKRKAARTAARARRIGDATPELMLGRKKKVAAEEKRVVTYSPRPARGSRAVEVSEHRYVNISRASPLIDELERMTGLPQGSYHLTKGQVDAITGCRFDLPAAR